MSLLLLAAAALFVRTLSNLNSIAVGFNRDNLLLVILPDARAHRFDQLLAYRLNRFGRDTRVTLHAVAELE